MRAISSSRPQAAALVVVLCLLVLLTFLVVAFFSRALLERQVSSGNTARERATLLSRSITADLVSDLLGEMRAGNFATNTSGGTLTPQDRLEKSYPSAPRFTAPYRVAGTNASLTNALNVVKMSVAGQPLYPHSAFPDGPSDTTKAAALGGSTATPSRSGRALNAERWNALALLPDAAGFTPPDWVRITRQGPETSGQNLSLANAADAASPHYVIGRYAFVIANLGGMLDVNTMGNGYAVSDDKNTTRQRPHQADFTAIRSASDPPLDETALRQRLVEWRWGAKSSDDTWLFDPKRSFLEPEEDQNLIFSRNELLAFQKKNSDLLTKTDLASLTVGSYEKNAPNFDRENQNAAGFHRAENQSIARSFFSSGPKAGQRVLSRRFDLHRLNLFKNGGSAADILKYFGLSQVGSADDWEYTATATGGPGFIRTLDEVAADPANPEPNFFEILKAVLNQNTLGIDQDGGKNNGGWFAAQEQWRTPDYQVFQIGANIIDQWDADDDPTRIQSSIGDSVWGIENLPYINQMFQWAASVPRDPVSTSPTAGRRFHQWFVPELWNPHRNAADSTATDFRIVGFGGVATRLTSQQGTAGAAVTRTGTTDLSRCAIEFSITQPLGAAKFADPSLIRQGSAVVATGAGTNESTAQADTNGLAGAGEENFLGLWAGATLVPDGHDRATGGGLEMLGSPSFGFELQYLKNGAWRTYQRFERFKRGIQRGSLSGGGRAAFTALWPVGAWTVSDPRCHRASRSDDQLSALGGISAPENTSLRFLYNPGPASYGPFTAANLINGDDKAAGTMSPETTLSATGVGDQPGLLATEAPSVVRPQTLGAAWNTYQPVSGRRWALKDRDGLVRFADGACLPLNENYAAPSQGKGPLTVPDPGGNVPVRPLVLNRAFKSVGELGYVLRDQPWKTLNFSLLPYRPDAGVTPGRSGDSGLLEVFTLVDAEATAGKIDLNTRNPRVIEAVLRHSEAWRQTASGTTARLSNADATALAENLVTATAANPLGSVSELVTYISQSSETSAQAGYNNANWIYPEVPAAGISKDQLEGPLRSLAALGTTRTWRLGVDLVVQVGRYTPSATDPARDFIVEAQQRYFITLTFDRIEGRLISRTMEPVYE